MKAKIFAIVLCVALLTPAFALAGTHSLSGSGSCTSSGCSGSFSAGPISGSGSITSSGGTGTLYYLGQLLVQLTFSFV